MATSSISATRVVKVGLACYDNNIDNKLVQSTKSQLCWLTKQSNKNDGKMFY